MTSWSSMPTWFRVIAGEVCTDRELDALKLKSRGLGRRRIARMLGISPSAVADRLESAQRKIKAHPDYPKETAA